MKRILLFVFSFITACQLCNAQTVVSEENGLLSLRNAKLELSIDLKEGAFSVIDRQKNWVILDKARFSFDGWTWNVGATEWAKKRIGSREHIQWAERTNPDGATVELRFANDDGRLLPVYLLSLTLDDEGEFVTFGIGMKNTLSYDCRLMNAQLFANAALFPGKNMQDLKTLNGAAGSTHAEVKGGMLRTAENSMLLTCLVNGVRYSIVWGGLRYDSYYATTDFDSKGRTISLRMQDSTGRLVRKGQEWWSTDTYYLGLCETDPFVALEKYGIEMRRANNASPNLYDFPTLCGLAVGALSKGEYITSQLHRDPINGDVYIFVRSLFRPS